MRRKSTVTDRNTAIDYINRDIINIKNELQTLNKLVRDGNGQPSLLQQVTMMRTDLDHLESELKEAIHDLKETVKNHHEFSVEKNKSTWQFKSVIWAALISGITSIVLHLIKP